MNRQNESHRRQNLLTGEWVLVSPHRTQRPWQGQHEDAEVARPPSYDQHCYLCPGNERANGRSNPVYSGPYAFDNDFPALSGTAGHEENSHPMFRSKPETGCCRVMCYSQLHDRHLADMSVEQVTDVLRFMAAEFSTLDQREDIAYVQSFENRGQMMGCSNPHPHAQVWASSDIPVEPAKEMHAQQAWFAGNGRSLLIDYLDAEIEAGERLVSNRKNAVSLVPFWAVWPFETLLIPKQKAGSLGDLQDRQLSDFAAILKDTLTACDNLFGTPMPYSMGFHPRPSDGAEHPGWQFHAHIYPPLLRSASVRKHMVGFEMLGMPQRDLTPEVAAGRLRKALDKAKDNDQEK